MPKQTITIEVDVPAGWEATGEHRRVTSGERYIAWALDGPYASSWYHDELSCDKYFILRRAWQPAPQMLSE